MAVSIFTLMAGKRPTSFATTFTFALVSIDRFIAIHKPIHSKLLCTPTHVLITIIMTWIACTSRCSSPARLP